MTSQLHHFVPRFHLRRFVDPAQKRELIWVYERGQEKPDLRPLDRVAAQKDYYAVEGEDGTKIQDAEAILSRIEGLAAPILQRFEESRSLSKMDRSKLSLFLAFASLRTPKFRDAAEDLLGESLMTFSRKLASDPSKFAESVKSAESALGESLGDPEELRLAITEQRIQIKARPEYSLKVMFEDAFQHATMIENMIWSVREAHDDDLLVTSDTPVVLNNPTCLDGNGPPTPFLEQLNGADTSLSTLLTRSPHWSSMACLIQLCA
jgi:hypothetical protein